MTMDSWIERELRLEQLLPLIQEQLNAGKSVRFSPRGISMLPMLRQGMDSVVLSPLPSKLKKYDLPLYRRENGQFVLHRIVKAGETYTCVGDNQFALEKGVEHSQIIGVCTAVQRKGKPNKSINSPLWRVYAVIWHYTRFPRHVFVAVLRRIKKIFK